MKDDPSLKDEQLEDEIRLVGELVLAASQSEGRMADAAIDEALGLRPRPAAGNGASASDSSGEEPRAPGYPASGLGP